MGLFTVTWSTQVEKILPPLLRDRTFTGVVADDFLTGDPTNEYIEYIVGTSPGHWKEFPQIGVNLYKYLQSSGSPEVIRREIMMQMANSTTDKASVFKRPNVVVDDFPVIKIETQLFQL